MARSLKVRRALVNGDFDSCAFYRVFGSFSESADNNQGLISKSDIFKLLFTEKFFSETKNHFSPMPFVTKFRFLPFTGLSFYIAMVIHDARNMQIWIIRKISYQNVYPILKTKI